MTRREAYIQALIALFGSTPDFPAKLARTLDDAFSRDEGNILVVHRGNEVPNTGTSGSALRDCGIRLSTITRGDSPEEESDAILEVAHPLIMTFRPAGLVQVKEIKTDEPKYGGGDGRTCLISVHYVFRYNTSPNTIAG
jgi:hypothetical protein